MDILYKQETYQIIGACMEAHKALGHGFLEAVYQEALEREFRLQQIPYQREVQLHISYKGVVLNKFYVADFVCFGKIILEMKALKELTTQHQSQVLNYLKATNFQLGVLVNFGAERLEYKRIIQSAVRELR